MVQANARSLGVARRYPPFVMNQPDYIAPDDVTAPNAAPRRPRRGWPLGALSLLVVGFVVGGVVIFGGDDEPGPTIPTIAGSGSRDLAPDFAIDLLDGTRFRLSEHLASDGRPVILNLWASWCGPCREEMPALDEVARAHPEVFLLGVAVDDAAADARRFADEIGVDYSLAIDDNDTVGSRYPSPGLPATFFIDRNGEIVRIVFGGVTRQQVEDLIAELFG